MSIGTSLLLGSKYGILLGVLISLIIIARLLREERMLVSELAGYQDYKYKVNYRLISYCLLSIYFSYNKHQL